MRKTLTIYITATITCLVFPWFCPHVGILTTVKYRTIIGFVSLGICAIIALRALNPYSRVLIKNIYFYIWIISIIFLVLADIQRCQYSTEVHRIVSYMNKAEDDFIKAPGDAERYERFDNTIHSLSFSSAPDDFAFVAARYRDTFLELSNCLRKREMTQVLELKNSIASIEVEYNRLYRKYE